MKFLLYPALLLAPSLYASPGQLDPSFGTGGIVSSNSVSATDVKFDEHYVYEAATGRSGETRVRRYDRFGQNTYVLPNGIEAFGGFPRIAVGSGGSVMVIVGNQLAQVVGSGTTAFQVTIPWLNQVLWQLEYDPSRDRYLALGSDYRTLYMFNVFGQLDTSFGQNGILDIGHTTRKFEIDETGRIYLGSQGKLLCDDVLVDCPDQAFITRRRPDGSLDRRFGIDGIASAYASVGIAHFARAEDGRLYLAADPGYSQRPRKLSVARFSSDGVIDLSFGAGGNFIAELEGGVGLREMEVAPNQPVSISGARPIPQLVFSGIGTQGLATVVVPYLERLAASSAIVQGYGVCASNGGDYVANIEVDSRVGYYIVGANSCAQGNVGLLTRHRFD